MNNIPHTNNTPHSALRIPHSFSLRRGLGFWDLTRGTDRATIKHEKGLEYVAWLMDHPSESLHALDLATRIAAMNGKANSAITEIKDPLSGHIVTVEAHSRIQERGLKLDDAQTMRYVLRKQRELEAYVEDEDNTGPEKDEAYQDLIALYNFEKKGQRRVRDTAAKASDAVGRAIKRLHNNLSTSKNADGTPNELLQAFAEHVRTHILIPSGRSTGHGGAREPGLGGLFEYIPTRR